MTIRWHEKQANLRYFFQKKMLEVIGLLSDQLLEINPFMIDYQYSLISETVLKVCKKKELNCQALFNDAFPSKGNISAKYLAEHNARMKAWRQGEVHLLVKEQESAVKAVRLERLVGNLDQGREERVIDFFGYRACREFTP